MMESNLSNVFSGSENLYKYLVSIGLLLIVLTVYYPLKEKEELEVLKIELEAEVEIVNYNIKQNKENIESLQTSITKNGVDSRKLELLTEIEAINRENTINHIRCKQKQNEIKVRKDYIYIYNILFWIFLPLGIIIAVVGFCRWWKVKQEDDKAVKLSTKKLELDVAKLEQEDESPKS